MSGTLTLTCSVCRRRFTGDTKYLRETIGPHAKTHEGREVQFAGETFVLSCNCGECDFCRKKRVPA